MDERNAVMEMAVLQKVSLAQLTVSGAAPPDIVTAAAKSGFGSVGLRLEARLAHEEFPHQATRNPAMLGEIRRRLIDTGITLSNVTGNYLTPETRKDDLARLTDAAAQLAGRFIVMVSYDPDEARTVEHLAMLSEIAATAKMKVALEFITYNFVKDLPQAWRIAQATGSKNVGLMIDAIHLSRSKATPADLRCVDSDRLFIAQLCDAKGPPPESRERLAAESRTARLFPGDGDLPLFDFLDAFPATSEIEIEAPHPAYLGLSTDERAKAAARASSAFLAAYANRRRPAV